MNNANPQSTANRRKQMATSMGPSLVSGAAIGAAIGKIALGLAIGIFIGGVGTLWRTRQK
jgi:hypothetical protein